MNVDSNGTNFLGPRSILVKMIFLVPQKWHSYQNIDLFVEISTGRLETFTRSQFDVPNLQKIEILFFFRKSNQSLFLMRLLNFSGNFSRITWNLCAIEAS